MKGVPIDINCDVGEGMGNEAMLFPYITSCNIACGGHAGDKNAMKHMVQLAKRYNVKIGAHPSYPDRENFGREALTISTEALQRSIKEQLGEFNAILREERVQLHHIKAHGALYNKMVKDRALSSLFLEAIKMYQNQVFLYVPYASEISIEAKERGFKIKNEVFGDRNYNVDLSLVSRTMENALIKDPKKVLAHVLHIIKTNTVKTIADKKIRTLADTVCIHGDTSTALEILMYLSKELPNHQVQPKK
ncbi:MAG: 5-oxoprolinase subunit PxpA [Flavobacteriaceae bacterium]